MAALLCGVGCVGVQAAPDGSAAPDGLAASVSFKATGDAVFPLAMYRQVRAQGQAKVLVDRFEHSGGDPRIEDAVVLPFQGQEHLFVIASWPLHHRGVGTTGTYYEIRAYREGASGRLQENPELPRHLATSGIDGSSEGEPSTFTGKDANELRALLQAAVPPRCAAGTSARCAGAPAGAERVAVLQPASTPTYDAFIDAVRAFSNGTTVELPGAGTAPLSDRIVAGFGQDPVRRLELQDGTTLYWGWQHRQAFIRSVAVSGPDGQMRLVAAARDLPRILNLRSGRVIGTPEEYDAYVQEQIEDDRAPSLVVVVRNQTALDAYYPLVLRWVQASALGFNADCSDPAQARSCTFVETLEVPAMAFAADCGSGYANDCPLSLRERTATDVPLEAFRQ